MANKISAGSYDLNKWLYGGYETDVITMIAGPPGSGKTNFVILAACSQAKKGNKVIISGGLTPDNVSKVLKYKPYAIDVASGVEKTPGKKDKVLVNKFIEEVKR